MTTDSEAPAEGRVTIRDAYAASSSLNDLAARVGCHYQTVRKMALSEGLAIPAKHWGRKYKPDATPGDRFEEDKAKTRLKAELADLKKLYAAAVKRANLHEDVLREARRLMGKCGPVKVTPPHVGTGTTTEDAILGWADWHADEVIDRDVMQGYNAYNPVIMCRRAQYTVDDTIDTLFGVHTGTTFERLWVFDLGDGITGDLLDESKATNSLGVMEAMLLVARLRARALSELSAHIPVIFVAVPGNHPRRAPKMQWKLPTSNGDWLMAEMTRDLCAGNDRVQVIAPRAWTAVVNVRGWNHSLNHGYSAARGGYGGVPWYALQRTDGKLTALESAHGQRVHYRWWGHIHQKSELPMMDGEGDQFIVGSLAGGNEYALGGLSAYADPVQKLVGCHDRHGVSWRQPLNVKLADDTPSRYEEMIP